MNNARAPFDDVRVRRALAHAIDRQAIVDGAMFGYGALIGSHFSPAHPAYVDLTALYPYDPRRARALLAEAGFPNGFRARLALPPVGYARRGGEIVAGYLRAVGVEADILNFEWAQWLEQVFTNKDYDLTIVSHTEPNDIGIYARPDYYFNYRSPAFDALIAELSETVNADRRSELLRLAQRRIAEDAVNVFLFELPQLGVWRKDLTGVWANAPVQANDLTRAHWAPSA
jgi:peptide/nickel transport system substrate-binding protein